MDSKIRIVASALFFIALIMAFTIYYTTKSKSKTITTLSDTQIIANEYTDWTIYSENGLYGIKNSDNEIIMDAKWDYLYSLGKGKYIVGESSHGVMSYGAVDEKGSIAIPVVYSKINVLNSEILSAETFENKFAVYDTSLNILCNEEFSQILKNTDGTYDFAAKSVTYTARVQKSGILIEKLQINCSIHTTNKLIELVLPEPVTYAHALEYINLVNESGDYIEALFYGDNDFKYKDELMDDSVLLGENLDSEKYFYQFDNVTPEITVDESGTQYKCTVSFTYDVPVADAENTEEYINNRYDVNAQLSFVKSFNGSFVLNSCSFSNT